MLSSLRGSSRNPIQILDEDQQVKKNEEMIEFQRNRQAIYRAHMGSNFDVLVAIIKLQIKGSDEEKDQVLRNRIRKFFSAQSKTIDVENEHFRKKREPDYSDARVDPVPNQLVLFGVDFISTKQIKQKFTGLNPDVQWLDDSNCKVKFNTHELAKRGIEMNLKNKSQSIVKLENDEMQLPKGWFELQSYYYLTFERKLWCRYAASNENELQIKRSNDYYMYQRAKQQFEESLKQQITEDKYYEIMTKYRFTDQHKIRERQEKNNRHQVGNGYRSNRYGRDDRNQRDGGRDQFRDRDDRNRRNWNNDNRNRDYNSRRNDDRQREQEQFKRSREKNNGSNQKDFDNISIISKGKSISSNRIRKPRKQSLSICSNDLNNSPSRENQSQENYSFILGQEQLSNSQQFAYQMKNLSIQSGNNDFERKNKQSQFKEQELSLSFFSNGEDNFKRKPEKNQSQNANLSFQFEPNRDMSKKKPDTSFNLGTSFSSVVKQKKIQQIQLYDNDQDK